jgi:hypothetical protein
MGSPGGWRLINDARVAWLRGAENLVGLTEPGHLAGRDPVA